jgi:hypothetical protein
MGYIAPNLSIVVSSVVASRSGFLFWSFDSDMICGSEFETGFLFEVHH